MPRSCKLLLLLALGLLAGAPAGLLVAVRLLPPVPLARFEDRSQVAVDHERRLLRAWLAADGRWRLLTTAHDVPKRYVDLLLEMEDRRFFDHAGVDVRALLRASWQLLTRGRIVSGGSTITMQVVRLLEPRERSLTEKLRQIVGAIQLERRLPKSEILDLYLTLAPFGGNIEGVRAAALVYFGKEPQRLSDSEIALLVALPQAPERRRPDLFPQAARDARHQVLTRAVGAKLLSPATAEHARTTPIPLVRRSLLGPAPHLSDLLRRRHPDRELIISLVDADLQGRVAAQLSRAEVVRRQRVSAAAVVVRNADLAVTAYVAGPSFFDDGKAGQVDLVRALRSPGSTLKPFIYGLAFEKLLLHPQSVVTDQPLRFGPYEPQNFSGGYLGDLTARESLIGSVNTTAVSVLGRLGPDVLIARLRAAGARLVLDDTDRQAGLAIALGGCGLSMLDLAGLYAALANRGRARPLRFTPDEPLSEGTQLLRADAAWAVADILADMPGPDGAVVVPLHTGRRIAYKTGTSYSFRDAWAVGFDRLHTVAVWVGRPDGAPNLGSIGRSTAAPLLFRVFDLLPHPGADVAGPAPSGSPLVRSARLPDRLQRFETAQPSQRPLAIDFPNDGTQIKRSADGSGRSLPLAASGGTPPYYWYVDGRPVASATTERQLRWTPDGPGQVDLRLIDSSGATAKVRFWVE